VTRPVLAVLALLPAACSARGAQTFPGAPVILVSIDTLRSDHLPAYGYRGVETPHLDRFRRDAILFADAWSPCPMTLPSHVTMLTGKNPPAHGVRNNLGFAFDSGAHPSLPALLRARGYAAGAAVSSYVLRGETGLAKAFDAYDDMIDPRPGAAFAEYQRLGPQTAAAARGWIAGRGGAPFFFFLHLYEPHVPYDPPEPYRSQAAHPYDGEIAAADAVVGDVLDALRASGVYDRAIVVVTSDHGEGLGDHGEDQHSILLYREALQVPLLLKLPGSRRGGDTVKEPVQLADILPTVADLLGIERPARLDGRSLLERLPARRALYAETLYPRLQLGWSDLRSMVDGRHHFIDGPRPEMYDYVADPAERTDVLATRAAEGERLRAALRAVPAGDRAPGEVSAEARERLSALGYAGALRAPAEGPLPNPRDSIAQLGAIRDALRLADAGRFAEAEAAAERLVAQQPGMVEAWTKLAEIRARAGRPAQAAEAYRQAIARCPSPGADMLLALGHAELAARRLDRAEEAARAAEAGSPGGALELRTRVALARGDLDRAHADAEALAARDRSPSALVLLAEVHARRGAYDEALAVLGRAQARAGELGLAPVFKLEFVRADALARKGAVAEAEAAYRREIAAFPSHLQAYANLAVLKFLQRDRAAVDQLLERMVHAAPGPEAHRLAEKTLAALGDRRGADAWRRRAEQAR
jgi:arylsulfatase A-like enzyme/Tfp pilus assembly protein PilF